jgi:hypothetical protein
VVNVTDRTDVNVRLIALKLTLCHLNASCERNEWPRRTGLVPPFKAFIAFAQDLIAGAISGKARPTARGPQPSAFLRRTSFAGRSGKM